MLTLLAKKKKKLGLIASTMARRQDFDVVFVNEASQQTEPASFMTLISSGPKAIFVGGYVQLRLSV